MIPDVLYLILIQDFNMVPLCIIANVTGGVVVSPRPIASKAVNLTELELGAAISRGNCSQRVKHDFEIVKSQYQQALDNQCDPVDLLHSISMLHDSSTDYEIVNPEVFKYANDYIVQLRKFLSHYITFTSRGTTPSKDAIC